MLIAGLLRSLSMSRRFCFDYSPDTTPARAWPRAWRHASDEWTSPPIVPHLPIQHPAVSSKTDSNIATTSIDKQDPFIALSFVSSIIKVLLKFFCRRRVGINRKIRKVVICVPIFHGASKDTFEFLLNG